MVVFHTCGVINAILIKKTTFPINFLSSHCKSNLSSSVSARRTSSVCHVDISCDVQQHHSVLCRL